jgi:hypothetical protein
MNAGLLFLPAVAVVGLVLLFATTVLERLIARPVQPLPPATSAGYTVVVDWGDQSCLAPCDPRNEKEGALWASS